MKTRNSIFADIPKGHAAQKKKTKLSDLFGRSKVPVSKQRQHRGATPLQRQEQSITDPHVKEMESVNRSFAAVYAKKRVESVEA